jgi:hypothetical protein
MQVDAALTSSPQDQQQHVHKTDSTDFGFMDFLFEEDTTENEEDNLFIPFAFAHSPSILFPATNTFRQTYESIPTKAFAFLKTPVFLTFRNIRL